MDLLFLSDSYQKSILLDIIFKLNPFLTLGVPWDLLALNLRWTQIKINYGLYLVTTLKSTSQEQLIQKKKKES